MHYQLEYPQGKLARVTEGEVFDVAVDLRKSSPTFGKWVGEILSAANKRMLWIPPGFAHGFLVLSDTAILLYKCTDYYHPKDDNSLLWNDPTISIDWPEIGIDPILSDRDKSAKPLFMLSTLSREYHKEVECRGPLSRRTQGFPFVTSIVT